MIQGRKESSLSPPAPPPVERKGTGKEQWLQHPFAAGLRGGGGSGPVPAQVQFSPQQGRPAVCTVGATLSCPGPKGEPPLAALWWTPPLKAGLCAERGARRGEPRALKGAPAAHQAAFPLPHLEEGSGGVRGEGGRGGAGWGGWGGGGAVVGEGARGGGEQWE